MTAPTKTVLPLVGSGSWYNTNREYRLESNQTTTTSVFYELYTNGSGDVQFGIEIKNDNKMYVMSSNNIGNPHEISVGIYVQGQTSVSIANGNRVSLYINDGTLLGQIDVDNTMLWSSGNNTEGSSGPSGSVYVNSSGQIVFVINGTSPSSDGTVAYKIFRKLADATFEQAYVVSHTSGTSPTDDTEYNVGSGSGYDRWELRVESSTGLVQSGTLAAYNFNKKVFCNFW